DSLKLFDDLEVVLKAPSIFNSLFTVPLYYKREEILLTVPNFNNLPPIVCHVPQLFSTPMQNFSSLSNPITYLNPSICPNKLISPILNQTSVSIFYEPDDSGNFSDGWTQFTEIKLKIKLEKEELKIPITISEYDLAENTYFQEKEVKPDPQGYILAGFAEENKYDSVIDIFDYYYREQVFPKTLTI
ncbi:20904_t:CDS:2, partial [Gigaspora rosea]